MSVDIPDIEEQDAVKSDAAAENILAIGETLRKAREALNLSIDHAARQLHLDVHLLQALETDNYVALPGTAYAYGYLRSYAKLLKLAEEEILQQFLQNTRTDSNALIPEHMTFAEKNKVPSFSFRQTVLMILFLILVLGSIAWVLLGGVLETTTDITMPSTVDKTDAVAITESNDVSISTVAETGLSIMDKQQIAQPDSQQVVHSNNVSIAAPAKELQLSYQEDSWTEVRDANGETLIYRMVNSGERLELEGQAPYTILLGFAPGVSVTYKTVVFDTKPYQRDDIAYFRVGQKRSNLATEE